MTDNIRTLNVVQGEPRRERAGCIQCQGCGYCGMRLTTDDEGAPLTVDCANCGDEMGDLVWASVGDED